MLNRITIRHGDIIHLHYYFSLERLRDLPSSVMHNPLQFAAFSLLLKLLENCPILNKFSNNDKKKRVISVFTLKISVKLAQAL